MSHLAAAKKYFSPDVAKSYVNNLQCQLALMAYKLCNPGEHVKNISNGTILESFPAQRELVVTIEDASGNTRTVKLCHPLRMFDKEWLDIMCARIG